MLTDSSESLSFAITKKNENLPFEIYILIDWK